MKAWLTQHPFAQGLLGALCAMVLAWLSLQAYYTYQVVTWARPIMLQALAQQAAQTKQAPATPAPSPSPEAKP